MMVERQGWGEIKEGAGAPLIRILEERCGHPTIVRMADGTEITTRDGTWWGRDYGDLWEHVISQADDGSAQFFYLSDVEALLDPDTRAVLASQVPSPGET
jgi:hypothetical protein